MIVKPIIPIWLMVIICIGLLVLKPKKTSAYIRQIIIVLLLFAINLRFMLPTGEVETKVIKTDARILFVIDSTISMVAEDYDGNKERLEGVKSDCQYIIDNLKGASFAAIKFDNSASILSPFTHDTLSVMDNINNITPPSSMNANGSTLSVGLSLMESTLSITKEDKMYVFFISDGEMNSNTSIKSFESIGKLCDGGAVLGYGTQKGGKMHVPYINGGEKELLYDDSKYPSEVAISKIDEDNLKQIAKDMGVNYIHMPDRDNLDDVITLINERSEESEETVKEEGYRDIYFWFVIPLAVLLVYEYIRRKQ